MEAFKPEETLRLAMHHAPVGMALVAPDGRFLKVNPALCRIVGYSEQELLAKDFQSITHPEDLATDTGYVQQMLKGEIGTYEIEKRYITRSNRAVWVLLSVSLVADDEGNPLFFISQIQDLTQRKKAERKLEESNSILRAFFDSGEPMRGVVVVKDEDIRHLLDNRQAAAFFGVKPEDMRDRLASELGVPRSVLTLWLNHYEESRRKGSEVQFEYLHEVEGSKTWLLAQVSHVGREVGDGNWFTYVVNDITSTKRQQEAMRSLAAELSEAQRVAGLGSWYWNRDTDEVNWTAEVYRIFRFDPALPAPRHESERINYEAESWERLQAAVARALESGESFQLDLQIRRHDGSGGWVQGRGEPVYDEAGRVTGLRGTMLDISERKWAEAKILEADHKLRQSLESTIAAIADTVQARDPYTSGHQRRVAELATAIAREMKLPKSTVDGIHFGALIHDLGKIHLPAEILSKPTRLTELEFSLIKTHPQGGYDILKGIDFPWPVATMVLQHHERLDGSGYPQGLKGDDVLLESRILAIADVVEAMSSHRPYRPGLGIQKALQEIQAHRGRAFDEQVVDTCCRLFAEERFAFSH